MNVKIGFCGNNTYILLDEYRLEQVVEHNVKEEAGTKQLHLVIEPSSIELVPIPYEWYSEFRGYMENHEPVFYQSPYRKVLLNTLFFLLGVISVVAIMLIMLKLRR